MLPSHNVFSAPCSYYLSSFLLTSASFLCNRQEQGTTVHPESQRHYFWCSEPAHCTCGRPSAAAVSAASCSSSAAGAGWLPSCPSLVVATPLSLAPAACTVSPAATAASAAACLTASSALAARLEALAPAAAAAAPLASYEGVEELRFGRWVNGLCGKRDLQKGTAAC